MNIDKVNYSLREDIGKMSACYFMEEILPGCDPGELEYRLAKLVAAAIDTYATAAAHEVTFSDN